MPSSNIALVIAILAIFLLGQARAIELLNTEWSVQIDEPFTLRWTGCDAAVTVDLFTVDDVLEMEDCEYDRVLLLYHSAHVVEVRELPADFNEPGIVVARDSNEYLFQADGTTLDSGSYYFRVQCDGDKDAVLSPAWDVADEVSSGDVADYTLPSPYSPSSSSSSSRPTPAAPLTETEATDGDDAPHPSGIDTSSPAFLAIVTVGGILGFAIIVSAISCLCKYGSAHDAFCGSRSRHVVRPKEEGGTEMEELPTYEAAVRDGARGGTGMLGAPGPSGTRGEGGGTTGTAPLRRIPE
ncbi:hypothetical protein F5Y15DRAFT_296677 [Xylariaceae sp. FL0016]|nr:hypothetical protein F5Y15DRAFT_296677 [Xylariaceae sp. FL0016]